MTEESFATQNISNFDDSSNLHDSSLLDNSISKIFIPALKQTQSIREFISNDQLPRFEEESEDKLIKDFELAITSAASQAFNLNEHATRRTRNKAPSSSFTNFKTRTQKGKIERPDYKKLNNLKKSKDTLSNVYQAKQILKSHVHMIRVLNALINNEILKLNHTFEFMNYK